MQTIDVFCHCLLQDAFSSFHCVTDFNTYRPFFYRHNAYIIKLKEHCLVQNGNKTFNHMIFPTLCLPDSKDASSVSWYLAAPLSRH